MVKVTFQGGPRDGQTQEYPYVPAIITCATEAVLKGISGVYRPDVTPDGSHIAVWEENAPGA